MSVSIYRGFRLRDMTVGDLQALVRRFRADAVPAAYGILAAHMAKEAAALIDAAALGKQNEGHDKPLSFVWEKVRGDWKRTKQERARSPDIDVECEIAFTPADGWLLGIVYTEQRALHDLWMRTSGAEEFSWWDGSDTRPAGVGKAAWKERERLWRLALPGFGSPMANGVSCTLIGDYLMAPEREAFVEAQPSLERRARRLAKDQVLHEFMAVPSKTGGDDEYMEAGFRAVNAAMERLRSPEGEARLDAVAAEIAAKLKPRLEAADLLGWKPKDGPAPAEAPAP